MGTKVLLWKLMRRPVAFAKLSRMAFTRESWPLLRPEEEQCVVDVLDDRAGEVVDEGMEQAATRVVHHPMQ